MRKRHGDIACVEPGLANFLQLARIILLLLIALGHLEADFEALRGACRRFRPLASAAWVKANSSNMATCMPRSCASSGNSATAVSSVLLTSIENFLARLAHARALDIAQTAWATSVTRALATSKFRLAVCSACQARMPATVAPTASMANSTAVAAIRRWRSRARLPEAAMKPSVGAPSSPG